VARCASRVRAVKGGLNSKLHVVCDGKVRPLIYGKSACLERPSIGLVSILHIDIQEGFPCFACTARPACDRSCRTLARSVGRTRCRGAQAGRSNRRSAGEGACRSISVIERGGLTKAGNGLVERSWHRRSQVMTHLGRPMARGTNESFPPH
jgi:hypothetical protein